MTREVSEATINESASTNRLHFNGHEIGTENANEFLLPTEEKKRSIDIGLHLYLKMNTSEKLSICLFFLCS